jgi:endoglucanase
VRQKVTIGAASHYFLGVRSSVAGILSRSVAPLLAAVSVVCAGVLAEPAADSVRVVPAPPMRLVDDSNPLAGRPFYVDPISLAMAAARRNPSSAELQTIANTPTAYWLDQAFPAGTVAGTVSRYAGNAAAAGATPVFAIYAIPHRDCGSYAAGGFSTGEQYRQWIDAVAAGLGSLPAAIILEPDAIAMAGCLSPEQRDERFALMRYAVDALTRDPAAAVYVDGGHSRWLSAEQLAAGLRDAGVDKARGFSLNTANFYTTEEEIGFGETVSGMVGGKHYVIDTSRNGAGPASADDPLHWCNPDGRALGVAPTTATAGAHADAYLWVKRPGESDGACGVGEAGAGQFITQYAVELVQNVGR